MSTDPAPTGSPAAQPVPPTAPGWAHEPVVAVQPTAPQQSLLPAGAGQSAPATDPAEPARPPGPAQSVRPTPDGRADAVVPGASAALPGPRARSGDDSDGDGLSVSVCRDPREFAGLAQEWTGLYRRCVAATPFQSHAWLSSWWESYGVPGRLRVVLVRRGGHLVAAAALTRVHRPLPVLVPLGGAITDYTDVLLADGDRAAVSALARGIRRTARGAVVDLREVRAGAAAEQVYACWPGAKRRLPGSVCLELPGLPMDGLVARVGSSRGQRIRAQLRKIDAAGVEECDVPPQDVASAVATMMRLHLLQWRGRGVNPEHERPRFAEHLARAGGRMVADGDAALTEFRLGGEVVAANLMVLSPRLAGGYLFGAHPNLRATKIDVTALLMRNAVRQAAAGDREVLSLMRGAEPHKFHWRPEHRVNQRLLLSGRGSAPALLARYGLARTRAAVARSPRLRRLLEPLRGIGRISRIGWIGRNQRPPDGA